MTQEEKAKAYDEALERAKEHINSKGIGDTVDLCKHLFPQLCESEDEKIRKAIIEFIKQGNINGSLRSCLGISEEQMIAYLEKQKLEEVQGPPQEEKQVSLNYEPPFDENPSDKEIIEALIHHLNEQNGFLTAINCVSTKAILNWLKKQKEQDKCPEYCVRSHCIGCSIYEKQKEQKPIDYPYLPGWRKNRDNNKPELKRSVLMLTTHGVAEGEWLGEKWCQYRWSCELKDGEVLYWIHLSDLERLEKEGEKRQKEQKPVECSEVELEFRGEKVTVKRPFYRDDKGRGYSTAEQDEDVAWNALRAWCEKKGISLYDLYPKAEWSEEDEKRVKEAIKRIDELEFLGIHCNNVRKVLESLRPSWKPSEEQMNVLRKFFIDGIKALTQTDCNTLNSIYLDLKKLI